jgi:predicted nucleotidyltransferase
MKNNTAGQKRVISSVEAVSKEEKRMKEKILAELKRIEQENDVKVLYAVESGSRAWGFPSKDSDYDVRFIYIHKRDWYLSIEQKRDVLEYPINDLLDISGWDLRKALQLLLKSNPVLLEWLRSPIVYSKQYDTAEQLRNISNQYISQKSKPLPLSSYGKQKLSSIYKEKR